MADPNGKIRTSRRIGGLKYPSDLDQSPVCFSISLTPYSVTGGTPGSSNTIYLPMPTNGLVDNYHIEFDRAALGAIGGVASTIANPSMGTVIGGIGSGLALFAKSIGTSLAEAAGDLVGQGAAAGAGAELMAGFVNNPNYAILFKGITPRTFTFKWTMIAKNASEARTINEIITLLKKSSLPAKQFGSNFALNYPDIAYLGVLGPSSGGMSKQMYITFSEKGAFVTNVSVNYSGAQHASFFKDNNPVLVELELQFQERGIVTSDDIIS